MTDINKWIGRQQTTQDVITQSNVNRFCATVINGAANSVNKTESSQQVPYGLHWCLCLPDESMAQLAEDGHPKKGGFIPPVDLPRRMWASSELEFHQDLSIGQTVERVSTIESINEKNGRSGQLVFVEVDHQTMAEGKLAIKERQTIVYKQASDKMMVLPKATKNEPNGWQVVKKIMPTPQLLFRYSALTFNSHRIHYDLEYAQQQEMYPALVVHGPLLATLMLDLMRREYPQAQQLFDDIKRSRDADYINRALDNTITRADCAQPA